MSITECPRCGYHLAKEVKEGVPALQAGVRRLEDLIPRLQEEKAVLLCRINSAQEKTRNLPFEVLSKIFQFARPPIDFTAHDSTFYDYYDSTPLMGDYHPSEDCLYTLAAVSHRWRQVAVLTPQLWTSISLRIYNVLTKFKTSLLDLHLKKSDNLPISIRLDFSGPAKVWARDAKRRSDYIMSLEPLRASIFVENADRVRSVILFRPPAEWSSSIGSNLSQCDSVTIGWPNSEHLDHRSGITPCFNLTNPPYVRHLILAGFTIPFSLQALGESPHLVELDIVEAKTMVPSSGSHNSEPIVLRHLEKLIWQDMNVELNLDFLDYFRFVNLKTLEWSERIFLSNPNSEEGKGLRLAFFSSLPSTLSSLTFGYMEIDFPSLVDLLYSIPHLAELYLTGSPLKLVVYAVDAIGRPFRNGGELASSHSNMLPNLCLLSISETEHEPKPFIFLDMFDALRAAGPRAKPFRLITNRVVDWTRNWDSDESTDSHSDDVLDEFRAKLSLGLDAILTFENSDGSTSTIP